MIFNQVKNIFAYWVLNIGYVCMSRENTARDYSEDYSNRLDQSRVNSPGNLRLPQNGKADNYLQNSQADNYHSSISRHSFRDVVKNKATEAEKYLPHEMREKLEELRQNYHDTKKLGGEAKTLVKSLTPWGLFSLMGKVHPLTDIPYFFAILAALLKDGLDLVGIGSLPAIGTVITVCDSLFIMMMMFLGNIMHEEHDRTIFQSVLLKQFGVLIFTTIVEFIFGLDLAPFQTVGVVLIYSFALAARKGRDAVVKE